jgi:hypothetical protein
MIPSDIIGFEKCRHICVTEQLTIAEMSFYKDMRSSGKSEGTGVEAARLGCAYADIAGRS